MANQLADTPEGSFPIEVPAGVVPGQQLTVSPGWSRECQGPQLFLKIELESMLTKYRELD